VFNNVFESIGVVIRCPCEDKWLIEEEITKQDLRVNTVIVKITPEKTISPLNKKILESSNKGFKVVTELISRS
jgi:hypothetical protein